MVLFDIVGWVWYTKALYRGIAPFIVVLLPWSWHCCPKYGPAPSILALLLESWCCSIHRGNAFQSCTDFFNASNSFSIMTLLPFICATATTMMTLLPSLWRSSFDCGLAPCVLVCSLQCESTLSIVGLIALSILGIPFQLLHCSLHRWAAPPTVTLLLRSLHCTFHLDTALTILAQILHRGSSSSIEALLLLL